MSENNNVPTPENENNQNNNQQPVQVQPSAPANETSWWDVTKAVAKGVAGITLLGLAAVGGYALVKHFGGSVAEAAAEATDTASELF